jgi:hypothetical protein
VKTDLPAATRVALALGVTLLLYENQAWLYLVSRAQK